jgi:uncharacterized protein YbcV (DUF1398 family)
MNQTLTDIARTTLDGAETGAIDFPQGVRMLMEAGFDGYAVDFRRAARTYYLPNGEALVLDTPPVPASVAERFDAAVVKEAIREAQALAPGYTYGGFCAKVTAAGCAGYMVSFTGKRVLYYGRSGETHTEYFPGTQPEPGR